MVNLAARLMTQLWDRRQTRSEGRELMQYLYASLAVSFMLWAGAGTAARAEGVPVPDKEQIRASLAGDIDALVEKYKVWDAGVNGGQGYSGSQTSGGLGWGEASFVRDYVYLFRVTGDTWWLDRMVDHTDRMKSTQKANAAGFMAWNDPAYSVSVITVEPAGEVGEVKVTPAEQRINKKKDVPDASGHTCELRFPQADRWVLHDLTAGAEVAAGEYDGVKLVLQQPEPGTLTVAGAAQPGARFTIKTETPAAVEYQVHDGMVTYRIAQFIEMVLASPELEAKYGARAREYLAWLDRDFLQKWESTWRDLDDGAGLYLFTADASQRFPAYSLPHNQYLAIARTWLVLADINEFANAPLARQRATAMALFFKRNLREVNGAYDWNYWDPLPGEAAPCWTEDFSHATIDVGFAVEAAARGVVFDQTDLQRFASTYVDVMWNGNLEAPRFGSRVNTSDGDKVIWADWIELAVADARIWTLAEALLAEQKYPVGMVSSVLEVRRRLLEP